MISGVVRARATAGVTAFVVLIWVSSQCFATLIYVTNRAWKTKAHSWWRLPLKSFMILGVTAGVFFLGMILPVVAKLIGIGTYLIPIVVIFLGLCLFYKLAPRCPVRFSEVWRASLITTILLQATEKLFVIYLKDFAGLNVVYGAFGSIIALLLWIYLSGCVFIFGACLCVARANEPQESPRVSA